MCVFFLELQNTDYCAFEILQKPTAAFAIAFYLCISGTKTSILLMKFIYYKKSKAARNIVLFLMKRLYLLCHDMFFLVYCMICYSVLTKANFLSITSLVVFVRHFSCFIQERRLQITKIETSLYYLPKIIAEKFSVKQLEILNINIGFWMTESKVVWVCY